MKFSKNLFDQIYIDVSIPKPGENIIQYELERENIGWLGVGLGPGMKNSDLNVGVMQDQTNFLLHDLWSLGYGRPEDDVQRGGSYDLTDIEYIPKDEKVVGSTYKIKYKRKFSTGDVNDFDIVLVYKNFKIIKDTNLTFFCAFGNETKPDFAYHGNGHYIFTKLFINSLTGEVLFDGVGQNTGDRTFFIVHGIILSIVWTLLNFFGLVTARYLKHHASWGMYHRIFNGTTFLATVIIGIISILKTTGGGDTIINLHHIGGFVILGLTTLQVIGGNIIYMLILSEKKILNSHSKLKSKYIHSIIGYLLYLITKAQIFIGFVMYFPDLLIIPITIFSFDIVCIIILEAYTRYNNTHKYEILFEQRENIEFLDSNIESSLKEKIEDSNNSLNDRRESLLNTSSKVTFSRGELIGTQTLGKKYVIYDNYIIDIGEFMSYHPGGLIHLEESLYNDISRYVTGTVAINGNFTPYSHSYSAVNFLHSRILGVLNENHQIIIDNKLGNSVYLHEYYEMTGRREIAYQTYELSFKPSLKDKNISYKYSRRLKGFSWIGKHFSITSKSLNKTRFYSICLCLNDYLYNLHLKLLENVTKRSVEESLGGYDLHNVAFQNDNKSLFDTLELYIKQYNFNNALSNLLTNYKVQSEFDQSTYFEGDLIINGPLGIGLDLNDYLSGVHVAFAGGTGAFCFLDFVAFVLRLMVYRVAKQKNYEEHFMIYDDEKEDFENVNKDFKLIYFTSFSSEKSSVFLNICKQMQNIENKFDLNIFKLITRISTIDQRWTHELIKNELKVYGEKIRRVFICGPTLFIDDIQDILIKNDIDKKKIHLV